MSYSNLSYGRIEQYVDVPSMSASSKNLISGYNLYLMNIILSVVKEQLGKYDSTGKPTDMLSGVKSLTINKELDSILSYFKAQDILSTYSYQLFYNYQAMSLDITLYLQFAYNVESINIETVIGV